MEAANDGLSSLIAFAGTTIPSRARFIGQAFAQCSYSAITIGLVGGQIGALTSFGPLVPFLVGSWVGYTYGCLGVWRHVRNMTLMCARNYPYVLAHSMVTEFDIEIPTTICNLKGKGDDGGEEDGCGDSTGGGTNEDNIETGKRMENWVCDGGLRRLSFAMLAAQSCSDDIAEIREGERKSLMDKYREKD